MLNAAAPGAGTTALQTIISTLTGLGVPLPGVVPTPTTPGGTTPTTPRTPPAGGAVVPRAGQPAFTAYRATVTKIVKVAKNRKSAKVTVSCPSTAPKGCLVTLDGTAAGKKAFTKKTVVIVRNVKKTFTVKLTSTVAKRLKKKGGSVKVTAQTALSSLRLGVSKTVKVAEAAQEGDARAERRTASLNHPSRPPRSMASGHGPRGR